jgi:UPF0755 protein
MRRFYKFLIAFLVLGLLGGAYFGYTLYRAVYAPNVVPSLESGYFFIPTGSSYTSVLQQLTSTGLLQRPNTFDWVARQKKYDKLVKPGKYRLKAGMSNNDLVDLLRSGQQEPVRVAIKSFRTTSELAGQLGRELEPDSLDFQSAFTSVDTAKKYGFDAVKFPCMILPNTYEFYWNTPVSNFLQRMAAQYKTFWNAERREKARLLNMSLSEITILAGIVQRETARKDEMPRIAGAYLNRLRIKMPLQADPTVVYAVGDFSIRRVLNKHKEIDSPYNTYKYAGLPPGPITIPEHDAIDAVLNTEQHNYIYFCAREDMSGYHAFAATYAEHQKNAARYRKKLDSMGILK